MARTKRERYRDELQKLADTDIPEESKELIREMADAHDPQTVSVTNPDRETVSDSTLGHYVSIMRRMAERSDFRLAEATAKDVNRYMDGLLSGDIEGVKDDGLTRGSVSNHQGVARVFFEYHHEIGVDPDEITLISKTDSDAVDENDIFDKDDIHAIRTAATHPRDKALVDMLLYTGQRLSAILNLRRKDIDLEEGVFTLNEDMGDLKGASGKRSLYYAENAVRDWYNNHPCPNDPDAHFITHKHDWQNKPYSAGDRLTNSTVYRQLQRIGERAGVDKPMNAHNFRHTFVTICKRNYGMDNDEIKRVIGHGEGSKIMETVYTHLSDDDVIESTERAMGIRDEEEEPESPLTPEVCDRCGEVIEKDDARFCPSCGTSFTPDAEEDRDEAQEQAEEKVVEVETDQEAEIVKAVLQDLRENPGEFLDE